MKQDTPACIFPGRQRPVTFLPITGSQKMAPLHPIARFNPAALLHPILASGTSASPLSNAVTVTGHFIYINLWLFISIVCVVILLVLLLIINAKKNRHGLRF